jgi:hypothetical protein
MIDPLSHNDTEYRRWLEHEGGQSLLQERYPTRERLAGRSAPPHRRAVVSGEYPGEAGKAVKLLAEEILQRLNEATE